MHKNIMELWPDLTASKLVQVLDRKPINLYLSADRLKMMRQGIAILGKLVTTYAEEALKVGSKEIPKDPRLIVKAMIEVIAGLHDRFLKGIYVDIEERHAPSSENGVPANGSSTGGMQQPDQ